MSNVQGLADHQGILRIVFPLMTDPSAATAQDELVAGLKRAGASLVGFADLTCLAADLRMGLPRAVSIAVALDPDVVAELTSGPTSNYHAEYDRVNARLAALSKQAAAAIESSGYSALTSAVTVRVIEGTGATPIPHKTVATRAGLGWIGDSALLITTEYGAAVRLASVLTDAPWVCGSAVQESRCGSCRACVEACPAGAITGEPWHPGIPRDRLVDVAACKRVASALAAKQGIDVTICGICVLACPWTRRYLRQTGVDMSVSGIAPASDL
jgi:epoxyqueuosine reductase QueG